MSQTEKVKPITKGIREDTFHLVMIKSSSTVQQFIIICKELQDARNSRIRLLKASVVTEYGGPHLPSGITLDSIQAMIHDVGRKELARLRQPPSLSTTVSSKTCIRTPIQRELATAVYTIRLTIAYYACANSMELPNPPPSDYTAHVPRVSTPIFPW